MTAIIAENNGAGMHTGTGAFWDAQCDGAWCRWPVCASLATAAPPIATDMVIEKLERGSILCIVSVYGLKLAPQDDEM